MSDGSGNGNGNGNDLNGNGRDWESKRHSRTPLVWTSPVLLLAAAYPAAFGQFHQVLAQHALSSSTTAAQKEGLCFLIRFLLFCTHLCRWLSPLMTVDKRWNRKSNYAHARKSLPVASPSCSLRNDRIDTPNLIKSDKKWERYRERKPKSDPNRK